MTGIIRNLRTTAFAKTYWIIKELWKFDITNAPLSKFNDTVIVLDKHAPIKMKYIRSNNCTFITKANWEKQLWTDQNYKISS